MKTIDVIGKSRDEIARLTGQYKRQELIDLIHQLATWEPKFSPRTVAAACEMTPQAIIARCKDGTIPRVHKPMENGFRIPLSSLREWDDATAISLALR